MGVPLVDCLKVAELMGTKFILNEFVAYQRLGKQFKLTSLYFPLWQITPFCFITSSSPMADGHLFVKPKSSSWNHIDNNWDAFIKGLCELVAEKIWKTVILPLLVVLGNQCCDSQLINNFDDWIIDSIISANHHPFLAENWSPPGVKVWQENQTCLSISQRQHFGFALVHYLVLKCCVADRNNRKKLNIFD